MNIENLSIKNTFNNKYIIKDFNFKANNGMYLLYGENGSGKTTLLYHLNNEKKTYFQAVTGNISKCKTILLSNNTNYPKDWKEKDVAKLICRANKKKLDNEYVPLYDDRALHSYSDGEFKYSIFKLLSLCKYDVLLIDEFITNLDYNNLELVFEILNIISKDTLIIIASNEKDIVQKFEKVIKI